jgi:hypothetical protein
MVTNPSIIKIVMVISWFIYIINLYRKLAQVLVSLELVSILEKSKVCSPVYEYFESYFIKNADVENSKFSYKYTNQTHEQEKTQLKAYYCMVLKDLEDVFHKYNKLILPWLIWLCYLSNLMILFAMEIRSYAYSNSRLAYLLRLITSQPQNRNVDNDYNLLLTQFMAFWLIIDFGVHVVHFYVDNHLIQKFCENFKKKLIKSLVLRFKFHQLALNHTKDNFPKLIHQKMLQELNEICEMKEKGLDLESQNAAMLGLIQGQDQANVMSEILRSKQIDSEPASKKGSSDSSYSDSSSNRSSSTEELKNYEIYEFSPMMAIKDKVLFIYYNKTKLALGRGLRSLLFNIPRLSILFMILNLIFTQTAVDYYLTMVCMILAFQSPRIFFDTNYFILILYALYFIINWMAIRLENIPSQLYENVSTLLAPSGLPQYSGVILLVGVSIFSLGFLILIFWMQFTLAQLLQIRVDTSKVYSLMTTDDYQVLDYKLWKKNTLSSVTFLFKVLHTKLLELFALTVFLICINIKGHLYFISIVLLIIFLLVLIDGLKSVKSMLTVFKFNTTTIGKARFVPATKAIRVICWVAIIYENYNIFKQINLATESMDLSFGVVLIYYLTLTVGDMLESDEYASNRQKVEKEENIKANFIALNYVYKLNEEKLIKRLHAFIGKSKLESMAKECATLKNLNDVKLHLDYNKKLITSKLDDIYQEMFEQIPSAFQRFKRKLIYKIFTYMYRHTNTFRSEDLFVLYQIASKRNCGIRKTEELDLKAYFCNQYKQLEDTMHDIETYYESHKENNESIASAVNFKLEKLKEHINKSSLASIQKGETISEMFKCEWMQKDLLSLIKQMDIGPHLATRNIRAAADILYKALTASQGFNLVGVKLESIKSHLTKKGLILAKFGKQKIALYNVHEESFTKTHGYVVLKFNSFISLLWMFALSNSVTIVFWIIAAISCINGSAFSIIIVGILLFAVLIEETYGNLAWWRFMNILYLIKLMFQMLSKESAGFLYFTMGGSIWLDIVQMVLTNVVMFQHKKTGFDDNHLMKIEDMGSAAVRILVNDDFFSFIDRSLVTHQKMCNELAAYIERKLSSQLSHDLLRDVKSKCTYLIVKLHHEIDTFKAEANQAAIHLFRRLKEDCYINTSNKSSEFLWRNFSIYARKPGQDFSMVSYGALLLILFYSIAFLQYSETGRNTMFAFVSGSQAISSLTVITITIYVTLLFIERCFDNVRTNDSITIHYHSVFSSISRELFCSNNMVQVQSIEKSGNSKFCKFKRAVKKAIILNKLKESKRDHKIYGSNLMFIKYIFLLFLWILISCLAFVTQPVFADSNRKLLFNKDLSSFMCVKDETNCFSFRTLPITKIFYFLNILYFFFSIQQIRKGKLQAVPPERNYSSLWEKIRHNVFYKTPILREICSLIDYSVQLTSLELSDYLLCEDIREYIANANILRKSANEKNPGKLVSRSQRVFLSWIIIFVLAILLTLPLLLFSKFTTGNKEQEITQGSLKMTLYAGENRYLTDLYESNFLLENRPLRNLL